MKWFAEVKSKGRTDHLVGRLENGRPVREDKLPLAERVEIEETDEGVYLLRFDRLGQSAGDTWHQSVAEARRQATFEFGLQDDDWRPIEVSE